jgi:phosphoribosyl-dephospho-CoA transferase
MVKHWLDKYIKKERKNRRVFGKDIANLQELAEQENWETKRK